MRHKNFPDYEMKVCRTNSQGSQAEPVRAESNHIPKEGRSDGRAICAVVLEESPMLLKTLSSILEERDDVQLVGTATDGYHALRRVVELAPDLVLMDLQLPGINGLDAARQIKARSQPPAVIVVTANDTPGCRAAARAAGTDGFVAKRHVFTQLRATIRKLFPGPTR
jgi:two-component system, NarL family, response regulator DesR